MSLYVEGVSVIAKDAWSALLFASIMGRPCIAPCFEGNHFHVGGSFGEEGEGVVKVLV